MHGEAMPGVILRQQQHLVGLITGRAYQLGHSFIQILDLACMAGIACQGVHPTAAAIQSSLVTACAGSTTDSYLADQCITAQLSEQRH